MAGFCLMNGAVGFAKPSYTHALFTAGPLYTLFFQVPHSTFFICLITFFQFSSVQFSHSVMSDSLQPHELQHARPPCPSPTPGARMP